MGSEAPVVHRKLSIGIVVRALPSQRLGGLEYHARDLAVALAGLGHSIHILSTPGAGYEIWPISNGYITLDEIGGAAEGNYSLGFYWKLKSGVEALCRRHNLNLIIAIDLAALFLNPGSFSVPMVAIIHGTMTSEVSLDWRHWKNLKLKAKFAAFWKYKTRILLKPVFRKMIRRMEHLVVDSEFSKHELLFTIQGGSSALEADQIMNEHGKRIELCRRISVVPLGIDSERYPETPANALYTAGGTLKIALLGRLQKIKGISQAIYAAQALVARGVIFEMNIGGSGNFADEAFRLIVRLGLQERVHLVGRVEPASVGDFLASHHVFLFPDLTQPAFGLVAVEAMHYGLPVIAAHVGAVPEVVTEETGWLYDPWDPQELAGILHQIADSPEFLKQKARAAKQRAKDFTAEKMGKVMGKVLVEIAAKHKSRQD